MDEIRELLDNEVSRELQNLDQFQPGSKEEQAAVENVVKLYKLRLEDDRTGIDYEEKSTRRQMEFDHEQYERDRNKEEDERQIKQNEDQKIFQWVRVGLDAAGIVLPICFTAFWLKKGFKFEEEGTFTSVTFRNLWSKMFRFVGK